MTSPTAFPFIVILSDLWKEMGWSAIIFIAALTAIDPNLYEAADIEGASNFQRIRYITLPGILDVIVVVVLLRLGTILNAGFHQIFILYSPAVYSVSDIIDTWVYRQGLLEFRFSLATAVGLFKGVIGLLLLLFTNRLIRRYTGSSLY
jgi:putative aldouronate transport system permease protein